MLTIASHFTKSFPCRFVGMTVLLAGWAGFALACDTPVYRYAMYRWEAAPYEVYYFHDQPLDEQAEQVKKAIETASQSKDKPANAFFISVPLGEDPEMKRIPPDVRKAWQAREDRTVPTYWVVTPHGWKVHEGTLDHATLETMWASPVRTEIAKQLGEGKVGVLVLVEGADAAENDRAEKVAKDLMAEMAAGKIELYLPPSMAVMDEDDAGAQLELGLVKTARTDPAEKWFIELLMSMEDDLKDDEFANQPMIFAVFGRGRALPPFIGKGISRDNLLECVYFLTGACSCTVRDQNPGMDLLFAENWWGVAEKLASTYGPEEGNETQLGAAQLFPHLMIPGGQQVAEASPAEAGSEHGEAKPADAEKSGTDGPASPVAMTGASADPVGEAPTGDADAAVEPIELQAASEARAPVAPQLAHGGVVHGTEPPQTATADAIGMFAVGAGLCLALVLLFGVTFLVMRPK